MNNKINLADLHKKFDDSINWNAIFFGANKISVTLISFLLYRKLTPEYFSIWANIYSIIFAVLLWADLGFRKSIPQFLPIFAQCELAHKNFFNFITKSQIISLLIGAALVLISIYAKQNIWSGPVAMGLAIFFVEGPMALLKLFYHSHFLNKEFNLIYSAVLFVEILCDVFCIFLFNDPYKIVMSIMLLKILSGIIINIFAILRLKDIYHRFNYQDKELNYQATKKEFVKHSALMWFTTNLKSLSERNVVIPFLTAFVGIEFANLFKIANDGAILIQRFILKLLGSSDTSLFAHMKKGCQKSLHGNFKKLADKTRALALPLFGLIGLLYLYQFHFSPYDYTLFKTFTILSIFYLIENLLCPYERVLEAHYDYKPLLISHVVYLIALLFFACGLIHKLPFFANISLSEFVLLLCCVRLVSFVIQACFVRVKYKLKFPYL